MQGSRLVRAGLFRRVFFFGDMVTQANATQGRLRLILSRLPICFGAGAFGDDRGRQRSAAARVSSNFAELNHQALTPINVRMVCGASKREQVVTEAPSVVSSVTKPHDVGKLARFARDGQGRRVDEERIGPTDA